MSIGHTSTAADGTQYAFKGGLAYLGGVSAGCVYFNPDSTVRVDSDGDAKIRPWPASDTAAAANR